MKRNAKANAVETPPPGGTVTGIVASPRAPGRFTVMVDGRSAHTLNLSTIERLKLSIGATTIGREDLIAREEAVLRTYDRAVMMLAARGRAAKDLERQLIRKGEPAEFARLAVDRLRDEGFVDDELFARSFVRSKAAGAGLARRRLQQELGRRGVDRGIADEAIAEVFEEDAIDEDASALQLAQKRNRSLRSEDAQSRRRRVYAFLARRGFSPDVIERALRAAGDAHHGSDSGEEIDTAPETP